VYLHIGQNVVISTRELLGIFDLDSSTVSRATREFLSGAERSGGVSNASDGLPRSFIVPADRHSARIYLSQIASATLGKRILSKAVEA
jgi:hypothetical protein